MRLRMQVAGLLTTALGLTAGVVAPVGAAAGEVTGQASGLVSGQLGRALSGEPVWGPVRNLSRPAAATYSPAVVLGRHGVATAAWIRGDDDRRVLSSVRRRDGRWTRPTGVPGTRRATEVALAIAGDGTRLLVWTTPHAVKAAHRSPGEPWSDSRRLHRTRSTRLFVSDLQLAVNDAGESVAAWQVLYIGPPGGATRTRVQAVVDDETGWTTARTLSETTEQSGSPAAAIDGRGRATVVWNEKVAGRWSVMAASRRLETHWTPPRAIDRGPAQPGSPELAATASGEVAVSWADQDDEAVHVVRWRPGTGWGAPADVPGVRAEIWWVDVGIDASRTATVVWSNRAGEAWSVTQTPGGEWARHRVADRGSVFERPVLLVEPAGEGLVGWISRVGGHHPVEVAYRGTSGGWGETAVLSGVPGDAFGPALALGAGGDGVAAWLFAPDIDRAGRVQSRYLHVG